MIIDVYPLSDIAKQPDHCSEATVEALISDNLGNSKEGSKLELLRELAHPSKVVAVVYEIFHLKSLSLQSRSFRELWGFTMLVATTVGGSCAS